MALGVAAMLEILALKIVGVSKSEWTSIFKFWLLCCAH